MGIPFSKLKKISFRITDSIGFLPTILSVLSFLFAILMLLIDSLEWADTLKEEFFWLEVHNEEVARDILTTIIGGIISLTVLSFSMVMVVISQATTNYSPKVVRGLVTHKPHQMVLGIYLGTIIYSLIILINVREFDDEFQIPSFSVLLAVFAAILCLSLFVYFIHSISEDIQIDNIIKRIYKQTRDAILSDKVSTSNSELEFVDNYNWTEYKAVNAGVFQGVRKKGMVKVAKEHDVVIKFEQKKSTHVLPESVLFSVNKPVEEFVLKDIYNRIDVFREEQPSIDYIYGFLLINEIATKALSPGINDSAVALSAIDYLASLLDLKMQYPDNLILYDQEHKPRVVFKGHTLEELLVTSFSQIRIFGKQDVMIMESLLMSIYKLSFRDVKEFKFQKELNDNAERILEDAFTGLTNKQDRQTINKLVFEMNRTGYFQLKPFGID